MSKLAEKVALVTGGSRGIGAAIAKRPANELQLGRNLKPFSREVHQLNPIARGTRFRYNCAVP